MKWQDDQNSGAFSAGTSSLFAVHGDLDGEKLSEFQEREQFIGLNIVGEEFLLPIAVVREIIMLPPITFVPNAQQFVDGVINLRGTILPALNMRKMMGFTRGEVTPNARIVVVRDEAMSFGLIVDGITYVVALLPNEIENQALPGHGTGAEFIGSMSKQGSRICGILDLARIIKHTGVVLDEGEGEEPAKEAA